MPENDTWKPEVERPPREEHVAREAVEYARRAALPRLPQDRHRVLVSLARVNDQRQAGFAGERDLRGEDRALTIARREVVVIVQADFADRSNAGVGGNPPADERHSPRPRPRRGERAARCGCTPAVVRTASQAAETRSTRATSAASVASAMHRAPSRPADTGPRMTASRSSANASSARWQWESIISLLDAGCPSGGRPIHARAQRRFLLESHEDRQAARALAARIIPFDWIPMSVAGFRLRQCRTRRPTSASGSYASAIPATSCGAPCRGPPRAS